MGGEQEKEKVREMKGHRCPYSLEGEDSGQKGRMPGRTQAPGRWEGSQGCRLPRVTR